ncbi:hypothetical protein IW492_11730 [Enterococcus sp. BWB1-3]|uniref:hypothetical protein n=1 Tax=unclassified Enterococcus TaxID=2608891 RepID=UPI00192179A7|nr:MULTISPECIES: hypothetical protein [unclassified Enterococcus]MBL1229902.1 hypothetical protein [Enterococcus sp. BWB1-3]MCB5954977.1 hypothetical protein [Enterococcus sp. CWB-B31]
MNKRIIFGLLSIGFLSLSACSKPDDQKDTSANSSSSEAALTDNTTASTETPEAQAPEAQPQAAITAMEVVQKFKEAGLGVNEERDMTPEDYGLAPMKAASGAIFGVYYSEYTASYLNGRVTVYTNLADLQEVKAFYDNLSAEDPQYKSWTAVNEEKLILLQMNGGIDEVAFGEFEYILGTV